MITQATVYFSHLTEKHQRYK